MPDNMSQSPWKATRDRQDISEEMFLNLTYGTLINPVTFGKPPDNMTLKLVVNTTLGYFEYQITTTAVSLALCSPKIRTIPAELTPTNASPSGNRKGRSR